MSEEIELKVKLVLTPELKELLSGSRVQIPPGPEKTVPGKLMIIGHEIILPRENGYEELANLVGKFAKLEEASEDASVFRMNQLSLWKAAEHYTTDEIIDFLKQHAKTPPKDSLKNWIARTMSVWGAFKIKSQDNFDVLEADPELLDRTLAIREVGQHIYKRISPTQARITQGHRGVLKQALLEQGFPVKDLGRYETFEPLQIDFKPDFKPYPDQEEALNEFLKYGAGTIIMPAGTGKTVIAVMITTKLKAPTLIITPKAEICEQFKNEFLTKTKVQVWKISVIHGGTTNKEIKPITITTYDSATGHIYDRLWKQQWGLIVFDEAQHVPAKIWSRTARLQAVRRLGLTATPVREDSQEKMIFSLIGPPVYDRGWLEMAEEGRIAKARCYEVLVDMPKSRWETYNRGTEWDKIVIASGNPAKLDVVEELLKKHENDQVLIIGFYLDGAYQIGKRFTIPVISGEMPINERHKYYEAFRKGELKRLVLTSVGEEGVDLPEANVAIEVAGLYGSRMKTSQRFGRILRPKEGEAIFYEVVSRGTVEQDFAERRLEFLLGKGYTFELIDFKKFQKEVEA